MRRWAWISMMSVKIENVSLSVRYARDPFATSQTSGAYRDRVNIKQYVRNDVPTRSPCTTRLGSSSPDRDGEVCRPTSFGFPNIDTERFESIRIRFLQPRPPEMSPTLIFSAGSVSNLGTQNRDEDCIYCRKSCFRRMGYWNGLAWIRKSI